MKMSTNNIIFRADIVNETVANLVKVLTEAHEEYEFNNAELIAIVAIFEDYITYRRLQSIFTQQSLINKNEGGDSIYG